MIAVLVEYAGNLWTLGVLAAAGYALTPPSSRRRSG